MLLAAISTLQIKNIVSFIGDLLCLRYLWYANIFAKKIASSIFDYWLFSAILLCIIAVPIAYLL